MKKYNDILSLNKQLNIVEDMENLIRRISTKLDSDYLIVKTENVTEEIEEGSFRSVFRAIYNYSVESAKLLKIKQNVMHKTSPIIDTISGVIYDKINLS